MCVLGGLTLHGNFLNQRFETHNSPSHLPPTGRANGRYRQSWEMFERARCRGGEAAKAAAIAKGRRFPATVGHSAPRFRGLAPCSKHYKHKFSPKLDLDLEREVDNADMRCTRLEALRGLLEDDTWTSTVRLLMSNEGDLLYYGSFIVDASVDAT
ncbi:hypothetical protein VaNZ11_013972 [Volvox africanus]|uniref:Uncharacterized protein n=1 Tax=Volvox africanus TaxID=51714 RepID=A0ABQ5SHG0_9CHLO|nr:hypothetical protein VaNZ11_013972 [Volvox africanus]